MCVVRTVVRTFCMCLSLLRRTGLASAVVANRTVVCAYAASCFARMPRICDTSRLDGVHTDGANHTSRSGLSICSRDWIALIAGSRQRSRGEFSIRAVPLATGLDHLRMADGLICCRVCVLSGIWARVGHWRVVFGDRVKPVYHDNAIILPYPVAQSGCCGFVSDCDLLGYTVVCRVGPSFLRPFSDSLSAEKSCYCW